MLIKALRRAGYSAVGTSALDNLVEVVNTTRLDCILLDVVFDTKRDGLEVCRRLRAWCAIPVIMLSVLNEEAVKVQALDVGADDYLSKPFHIDELLARIHAIERRLQVQPTKLARRVVTGVLEVDLDSPFVTLNRQPIHLTHNEYLILKALAEKLGQVVTYEGLADIIWTRTRVSKIVRIRRTVLALRKKLGEDITSPQYILSDPKVGYRLAIRD